MTRRFLLAIALAAGLAGCGNGADNDEKARNGTEFQDVKITRNADSTFTLESKDQTLKDISSVQVKDSDQSSAVRQFLEAPVDDSGGGGSLCCNSCSLSGGVLICTGCRPC